MRVAIGTVIGWGANDAINVEWRALTKGSLDPSPQTFPSKAANYLNTNKTDPCAIKLGRFFRAHKNVNNLILDETSF